MNHFVSISSSEVTFNYNQLLDSIQRVVHQEGYDGSNPQSLQRPVGRACLAVGGSAPLEKQIGLLTRCRNYGNRHVITVPTIVLFLCFSFLYEQKRPKTILRGGIECLGSVLWGDDICSEERPENQHSLARFLYTLRGLLRTSLSVCVITVPTHLIQTKAITTRLRNLSDTVVGLESFIGSEMEASPLYRDYHGLLHVHQIPRLNSLISDVSNTKDLAFKLKRKIFAIERLHLPPDLSDTVSRSSKPNLAGTAKLLSSGRCLTAGGEKHLDF
ncbi:elongator complex protein 4-like [Xenopus laevis]|uniref:Elongator complex protein 4 n=1 Tax=Xenopus laevis TaxID=8355 RepID=A0A8J1MUT7_XENLA|nr:elongator complex protein 4-like [Xenopus laevis]